MTTKTRTTLVTGVTWTAVTDSAFGTSDINGIAYGGGKFVAVGKDGKMAYWVTQ
jgi:hypothetical protein